MSHVVAAELAADTIKKSLELIKSEVEKLRTQVIATASVVRGLKTIPGKLIELRDLAAKARAENYLELGTKLTTLEVKLATELQELEEITKTLDSIALKLLEIMQVLEEAVRLSQEAVAESRRWQSRKTLNDISDETLLALLYVLWCRYRSEVLNLLSSKVIIEKLKDFGVEVTEDELYARVSKIFINEALQHGYIKQLASSVGVPELATVVFAPGKPPEFSIYFKTECSKDLADKCLRYIEEKLGKS